MMMMGRGSTRAGFGTFEILLTVLIVGLNLAWLIPFIVYMRRAAKRESASCAIRQRLLETGRSAMAVIIKVDEVGPWLNKVPHLNFTVRVQPPNEPPFEATSRAFFRMIDFGRLHVGAQAEVRFDPADRSTVAMVGDQLR